MRTVSSSLGIIAVLLVTGPALVSGQDSKHEQTVAVGLNMTSGNSETLTTSAALNSKTEAGSNITVAEISAAYGETETETETETDDGARTDVTAQNAKGHANYKRMLSKATAAYVDGLVTHDRVAEVDYRAILGAGGGFFFLKTDKAELSLETGVGYLWEAVAEVEDDYLTLRFAQRGEVKLSDKAKAWEAVEYLPKADDFDDYLLNIEVGIEAAATDGLGLRFVIQNKHDSTPAADKEETDTVIIAALTWSL